MQTLSLFLMNGCQNGKLVEAGSVACRQEVDDQSPFNRRPVAEDFRVKELIKLVPTDRRPIGDCSAACLRLISDFKKTFATCRRSKSLMHAQKLAAATDRRSC